MCFQSNDNFYVFVTVTKVTVQRCEYSIGARKSTRKLTKITETLSDEISVMLPLPDCPRNSPKTHGHQVRAVFMQYQGLYLLCPLANQRLSCLALKLPSTKAVQLLSCLAPQPPSPLLPQCLSILASQQYRILAFWNTKK